MDIARFGKVRALYDRTDSQGEKASAAQVLETLAAEAGLSLAEAFASHDISVEPPVDLFRGLFDKPQQRAERQRRRVVRIMIERGYTNRQIARSAGVPRAYVRALRRTMT